MVKAKYRIGIVISGNTLKLHVNSCATQQLENFVSVDADCSKFLDL